MNSKVMHTSLPPAGINKQLHGYEHGQFDAKLMGTIGKKDHKLPSPAVMGSHPGSRGTSQMSTVHHSQAQN